MKEELKVVISADTTDLQKDVKKGKKEIENFEDSVDKAAKDTEKDFQIIADAASQCGEIMKTGLAVGATAAAALGTAIVSITENSREYRNAQEKLNTAFKSAGSDAKTASKVYKELNSVLGDSDKAVEAAAHLAKLTTNQQDLEKWTKICTGVYATFGESIPIEGLTEAANETAKTGKLTGNLADALNWAGISEDDFQASLDACTTEQERQKIIMDTLIGTYSDAANEFQRANKEIIESNKATEEWNNTMAEIGASFEPVITEVKKLGVEVLQNAQEPLDDLAETLEEDVIPHLVKMGKWVAEHKSEILSLITGAATALVTYQAASMAAKLADEGLTLATVAQTTAQKALNLVMNANPYVLATTAIVGLTTALIAYGVATSDATEDVEVLTEAEKLLIEESAKASEEFNSMKTANEEAASAIQASMDNTSKLATELMTLVDASGQVKEADEARVKFILNELNQALGTEYSMVDGVIQQYDELKTTIYDVIAAKTANSLLEVRNEAYLQALQNEDDALRALIAAQKDKEAQVEETKAAEQKYVEFNEKFQKKLADAKTESDYRALASEAQYRQQLEANWKKEERELKEKETAYDKAAENYGMYYDTITEYEEAAMAIQEGNYEDAIEMLTNKGAAFLDYADDVDEATKKAVDALYKEAIDAGIEAERTKENFQNGVKGYTEEMVTEAEKAYEDAMNAWSDAYDDANGIGKEFGGGLTTGLTNSRIPYRAQDLYDQTLRTWDKAGSGGNQVGQALGDGVAVGLESKKMGLISKAKALISSIWNAMKREAQSNSPSKKTIKLGNDMGAGLGIGFDESTADAVKSAQNMIKKTMIPIETTIADISVNDISSIFDGINQRSLEPAISSDTGTIQSTQLVSQLVEALGTNNTPIVLQVDGKVFAETSVSSINKLTRQTGNLGLVLV